MDDLENTLNGLFDALESIDYAIRRIDEMLGVWEERITTPLFPEYVVRTIRNLRRFQPRPGAPFRSYIETQRIVEFGSTYTIHPETYDNFVEFVDNQILNGQFYGAEILIPFMVSFTFADGIHSNYHYALWQYAFLGRLEKYDDTFFADSITIHYRNIRDTDSLPDIRARRGEGISYKYGDVWIVDLFISRRYCIPNAFISWRYYRDRKLHNLMVMEPRRFRRTRDNILCYYKPNTIFSTGMMSEIMIHEYRVIYNEDQLVGISPDETLNTCVYYYKCGHVGLVVHDSCLSNDERELLSKSGNTAYISMIRAVEPKPQKHDIVIGDIECYRRSRKKGYLHEPRIIGIYDGSEYISFRGRSCIDGFFSYIISCSKSMIIWFHNAGKYDTHFLIEAATRFCDMSLENPLVFKDLDGVLIEMVINLSNGHCIKIRDSYRLLPASLKNLAIDYGVTQKIDYIDIVNATEDELLYSPHLLEYNRIDCKALHEILDKYQTVCIDSLGNNPLNFVTASSFAKNLFFSKYYDSESSPLYVLTKKIHEFIMRGYGGGRNETFVIKHLSKTRLYTYDFTSLYPHAGCLLLPYSPPKYVENMDVPMNKQEETLRQYPGYYEVTIIKSPENRLPLHGVLHNHRYVFPNFKNSGKHVFFSIELLKGLELGYEYKFHSACLCKLKSFAKKYFEDLFILKRNASEAGKPAIKQSIKITINSGYGYFGFNKYNRNQLKAYGPGSEGHLEELYRQGLLEYKNYNGVNIALEQEDVLLQDVNVAVAAAITSHARMMLYDLIVDIQTAGGKVLYTDTDSIITDLHIESNTFLSRKYLGKGRGKNLGELHNELEDDDFIERAVFAGCKTYGYITSKGKVIVKAKGLKQNDINDSELLTVLPKFRNLGHSQEEPLVRNFRKETQIKDDSYIDLVHKKYFHPDIETTRKKWLFALMVRLMWLPQKCQYNYISSSRQRKVRHDLNVYEYTGTKILSGRYVKGIVDSEGNVTPLTLTDLF